MNPDQTSTPPNQVGWEIRRKGKVYSVPNNELLVKIFREGRFSGTDQIRRKSETQWRLISGVNFSALETIASQDLSTSIIAPVSSSASLPSNNGNSTGSVVGSQPSTAATSFWHEDNETPASTAPHQGKRIAIALVASSVVSLVIGLAAFAFLFKQTDDIIASTKATAMSPDTAALPQNKTPTGHSDASVVPETQDASSNNAEPEQYNAPETESSTPTNESASKVGERIASEVPIVPAPVKSEPEIDSQPDAPGSKSSENSSAAPPVSVEPATPPVLPTVDDPESSDTMSSSMEDRIEVVERQSESQILAMKSYVDKLYDEIDSKVKFYRRTNEILREARKKANDAIQESEKLVLELNVLKVNMAQTEEQMFAISAWLLAPAGTANTLQNQILQNQQELSRLKVSYQKMIAYRDNCLLKQNGEKGQLIQAEKEFKETCVKEKESLKGLLDSIDFFDEFPLEVHQRVFEQSRQWFATEPDFFLAYLLNSVAAVHLGEFKVPETNLAEMRRQAGLISSADQAARAIALNRFETVAITIVGLSEYKQQRPSDASETMKEVFRTEQDMVEAWLLRGKIGLSKKGQPDGMNFFKKAVNLDRQSPRVYRIALDALVAQDEFPESTVRGLLDNLIKRAGPTDERAMLTAATACHKLGDSDNALKYLDKVKVPYLIDQANKLRESISAK
jgi:hypothetical protein